MNKYEFVFTNKRSPIKVETIVHRNLAFCKTFEDFYYMNSENSEIPDLHCISSIKDLCGIRHATVYCNETCHERTDFSVIMGEIKRRKFKIVEWTPPIPF